MEWRLLIGNLAGALALAKRTEAWLAGGAIAVIVSAGKRIAYDRLPALDWHDPVAMAQAFALDFAFALGVFTILALLAHALATDRDSVGSGALEDDDGATLGLDWPAIVPSLLGCALLTLLIDNAIAFAEGARLLAPLREWHVAFVVWPMAFVVVMLPMVRVACVAMGHGDIALGHVARRIAAHAVSWLGGFLVIGLAIALMQNAVSLAASQYLAHFGDVSITAFITGLALAKATGFLALFLYTIRAVRVLAAGIQDDPCEVFG